MYSNAAIEFPQGILSSINNLSPKSREEMKKQITDILGKSFVYMLDTHNTQSVIFIFFYKDKKYLLKLELQSGGTSLEKEINWYKNIGVSFPNCPKYLGSTIGKNIVVLLLLYIDDAPTIDEMVLQSKINPDQTWRLIKEVVMLLNSLFKSNPEKKVSLSEANVLFLEKYKSRFEEARSCEYLQKLFGFQNLYINDQVFPNFEFYISKIVNNERLKKLLTPNKYGVIHGDLHCGNILVKRNQVYFVDPNGNLFMPIEYDYGKLFHSIHGGYGSIMNGNYKLAQLNENRFEFSIKTPKAYKLSFDKIVKTISPDLLMRSLYSEAMHFVTMLPHHAKDKKETTAIFIKGIILFKELFDFLESD